MIIIDAEDAILGRLASRAAKESLKGEEVVIVNAEKAIISGRREYVFAQYLETRQRKSVVNPSRHGPKFPRRPEAIVKRTVRGMLPWHIAKGRSAYKRIKVYIGIPRGIKKEDIIKIEENIKKLTIPKYVRLDELGRYLGAKF